MRGGREGADNLNIPREKIAKSGLTLVTLTGPPRGAAVIAVRTTNTGPYSATATTFTNYLPNSNCGSHVDVYTLQ
jgi:hypothetical protein